MKAAIFRKFGYDPKAIIKIEETDSPHLKSNEVMIKVEATSHNYDDLWAVYGHPITVPLPHISGSDAAGTIVEVGEDVTKFKIGDRVAVYPNISCKICNSCNLGKEFDCDERMVWGYQTGPLWGGFAQYTHMPENNIVKIPDELSFNDAAAISMVGMTSWHILIRRARIRPRQTILVMGGSSGVGMAAIQIAKLYNCNVIATASTKEKADVCYSLGADHVVDHRNDNWNRRVREITKNQGIDVIVEHLGKTYFPDEVRLLKKGGTLVSTGATTGYDANIDLRYLFFKGINILGSTQGSKVELEEVIHWTSKGKIKPIINTILPFSNIVDGYMMMAEGNHFGKIVITPQKL